MHPVDPAVPVGMGDNHIVIAGPVDVAFGSITALIDGILQRGQRIVRSIAFGCTAAMRDDIVVTGCRFEQSVIDLFIGIRYLAPIGLIGPLVLRTRGECHDRRHYGT